MTDAAGNTARLERDARGRVDRGDHAVRRTGPPTATTPAGLLASRRDPDGAIWRYEHTAAGRLTAVIDPHRRPDRDRARRPRRGDPHRSTRSAAR